ncbi:hypothetical protein [Novosphingobium sp. FKTRR1]|uniref:hypothetical protein n=1 Tax=Novosphingobium sp. FKTRR1 TaxID=2879118 RepID=UPI001CF0881F|nr:hypothetical protein [Novosphingobium sp. FKTRR1]
MDETGRGRAVNRGVSVEPRAGLAGHGALQPLPAGRGAITTSRRDVASTAARGRYADLGGEQIEQTAYGRAQDAYNEIMAGLGAMIAAIMQDGSLTYAQKIGAVAALRQTKKAEAKAVRSRIIAEEKAKVKARRKRGGRGKGPRPRGPTLH